MDILDEDYFLFDHLSREERLFCEEERKLGKAAGEFAIESYAYDCESYRANAELLNEGIKSVRLSFQEEANATRCFKAGWLLGAGKVSVKMLKLCEIETK